MPPILSRQEAAKYLGVHPGTLTRWARTGMGPTYLRVGARGIRYRKSDLDAYLAEQTCDPVIDHYGRAI
ncbi:MULTISPECIES: helix-turn-helix domain-containing protein [unclassified Citromicrobium]|uniref:helix-turn-helix transcriptional regulator n=1 Tax=unclassified Citromicrobium TaxID=2630544 RepID=UPI0009E83619|tara:strand:- start:12017 stop:12223 length:207 start_codon:yes stop_codon:yes gene_type:complete